jgi:hypothetical protein
VREERFQRDVSIVFVERERWRPLIGPPLKMIAGRGFGTGITPNGVTR